MILKPIIFKSVMLNTYLNPHHGLRIFCLRKMCGLNSILLTKSSKTFNVIPCQCLGTEVSIFLPSSPFFSFSYLNAFRYKVPTCNFPFLFYTTFFIHFPLCISFCPTATINFSYTCFNEVGCLYVCSQPILAFI